MAAEPVVNEVAASQASSTKTARTSNGSSIKKGTNGDHAHGVLSPPFSPESQAFTDSLTVLNNIPKINILRETTTRVTTFIKTRLGSSCDVVLKEAQTFDDFLEALEDIRLRYMPHDGSKWDKVLKWAENFAGFIYKFNESVKIYMLHSEEATRIIWGNCLSLLQVCCNPNSSNGAILNPLDRWDLGRLACSRRLSLFSISWGFRFPCFCAKISHLVPRRKSAVSLLLHTRNWCKSLAT